MVKRATRLKLLEKERVDIEEIEKSKKETEWLQADGSQCCTYCFLTLAIITFTNRDVLCRDFLSADGSHFFPRSVVLIYNANL